jgi:hypothetical protein
MVVGDVSDRCVIHDRHKGILQAIMTSKKVVKSVTEQHNGQMCIAGGASGIWEKTFIASSRTKNSQNCSSAYFLPIRRKSSTTYGKN